jgi:hypothetical protein
MEVEGQSLARTLVSFLVSSVLFKTLQSFEKLPTLLLLQWRSLCKLDLSVGMNRLACSKLFAIVGEAGMSVYSQAYRVLPGSC